MVYGFSSIQHVELTSDMETDPLRKLDNLLPMYENSWNTETEIFLNHLDSKKQVMEKISSLEKEVEENRLIMETLSERTRPDYNKLEEIYHCLKAREALYENHLKCILSQERPNVYKISFLNDDLSVRGCILFKHDQTKNTWIVSETQPPNVVSDEMIDEFNGLQDTQGFICYFRHLLFST